MVRERNFPGHCDPVFKTNPVRTPGGYRMLLKDKMLICPDCRETFREMLKFPMKKDVTDKLTVQRIFFGIPD
jgi:hypothetical protein